MDVHVVIPHYAQTDMLDRTLAALSGWSVLVVDDSEDGVEPSGWPTIRTAGGLGFAQAVNVGLRQVQAWGASHGLVLNDDAVPRDGAIDTLCDHWRASDGAIAPLIAESDGGLSGGYAGGRSGRVQRLGPPDRPTSVDVVSGACMLVRSSERFDSGYRHGFEDFELCRRLWRRGLGVRTIPSAVVDHVGGGTIPRGSRCAQRHGLSGHLRYLGGGWRGGYAVALSVAQVIRECGPADRLLGIAEGCRDYWVGTSDGASSARINERAASMACDRPGSSNTR